MAGKAKSDEEKTRIKRVQRDARMRLALDEYNAYKAANPGPPKKGHGLRSIAEKHCVKWRTLGDLANGKTSQTDFNKTKRKLLPEEESQLLFFTLTSADRGFGFDIEGLHDVASALIGARDPSLLPLGHNFIDRFISRHPQLKGHWARALSKVRANAGNPEVMDHWFTNVVWKNIYERREGLPPIAPDMLFGGDESAVSKGFHNRARIIGRSDAKMAYQQGVEDRELITVLPTICADGTFIRPLYIFAGELLQGEWQRNNVLKGAFAVSPNGWTDNKLALWWLEHVFDEETRAKAAGRTRVLFLDGHGSHLSLPFLKYAVANDILILAYPPHTTHLLQGLDVVAFAVLKKEYAKEVKAFEEKSGGRGLRKRDFACVFGTAFLRAFTVETIQAAFAATGICPYDPNAVDKRKMAPSEAASIHGAFPLEQPTPIRRIMAAWATTAPVPRPTTPVPFTIDPLLQSDTLPSTPKRPNLPNMSMYTPCTRWRTLEASLGQSTTASILVSETRITATQVDVLNSSPVLERVPGVVKPDWMLIDNPLADAEALRAALAAAHRENLALKGMLEGSNATSVLQHLVVKKLNLSLHGKEEMDKDKGRTLFSKGFGRVATDEAMMEEMQRIADDKETEAVAKDARKSKRELRKAAKEAVEREWADMKLAHIANVLAYEQELAQAKELRLPKGQWPKKPKIGRKPKPAEPEDDDEDDEDGAESGEEQMEF